MRVDRKSVFSLRFSICSWITLALLRRPFYSNDFPASVRHFVIGRPIKGFTNTVSKRKNKIVFLVVNRRFFVECTEILNDFYFFFQHFNYTRFSPCLYSYSNQRVLFERYLQFCIAFWTSFRTHGRHPSHRLFHRRFNGTAIQRFLNLYSTFLRFQKHLPLASNLFFFLILFFFIL